ncbi:spliceosome-associated protein CWC27 homolog [Chelonus insularis]|uniref:spliceosome-associated protein CWC27 homolog n=1 Tax=Chelonus insularis TaxID=460826 RepID=UPI00158F2FCA|nr:spliceosome-associated protein CWC27 homolog [Chelonus insularis]
MSSIYIQEPPTSGKVLLITTVGDIEIELWTKETPKTCRNFIKLCYDGYYNGTIFHRVVKRFIVQGGDPTGTGEGGESADGHSVKDEFHSRLRFCRRGLVAMANAGKDTNTSQFFITLGATPELQNKHTIFGKIVGDTIYNVLKLEEAEIDHDERPVYPQKILKTKVLLNPFDDLVPTIVSKKEDKVEKVHKKKPTGVKNLKLLSFGEEAEEDEETLDTLNKQLSGKSKSAHDHLQDPKLSSYTDTELIEVLNNKSNSSDSDNEKNNDKEKLEDPDEIKKKEDIKKRVIDKLKNEKSHSKKSKLKNSEDNKGNREDSGDEVFFTSRERKHQEKLGAIKKEIKNLKKSIRKGDKIDQVEESSKKETAKTEVMNDYMAIQEQYKKGKKSSQSGDSRENLTLQLLNSFKKKLRHAKEHTVNESTNEPKDGDDDNDDNDEKTWMIHSLQCESQGTVLAKDASTKSDDWFEIYDPRNPINKRRRGENSDQNKKKKY